MVDVIPVIDLKGGKVVRARQGLRHAYAPLETRLASTCAPVDVAAGLLSLHPFRTIYVADLDHIERMGSQENEIDTLIMAFPSITFWIDAGVREADEARAFLARYKKAQLVLGSESLTSHTVLEDLAEQDRIVLSLDYSGDRFVGPERLCDLPQLWPKRVILMSLERVGSRAGPCIERLAAIKCLAPHVLLFAAGGLRRASDLTLLKNAGISGVLVASALHDGHLTSDDLAAAAQAKAAREK